MASWPNTHGVFEPCNTICGIHSGLDLAELGIRERADRMARQANTRLDEMVARMHHEAGINWLRARLRAGR